ncbi:uncharacterized protein Dwil_GK27224 [Drosophila willistoni]|uniref:DUF4794 domain-containing protein n=1 Tax=Drosophila willistoni TaxID=7260 RepID=A0A0Q9WST4_DROWI|nr:uncharacterized protein LOC26529226 [Drosophila willistoni]KRF99311.1 uncharacterized protein Dwil_GK27224 [Drosophila willistoni]
MLAQLLILLLIGWNGLEAAPQGKSPRFLADQGPDYLPVPLPTTSPRPKQTSTTPLYQPTEEKDVQPTDNNASSQDLPKQGGPNTLNVPLPTTPRTIQRDDTSAGLPPYYISCGCGSSDDYHYVNHEVPRVLRIHEKILRLISPWLPF